MSSDPKPVDIPPLRCPECSDGKLLERINRTNGSHFMGCTNWPDCKYSQEIPAFVHMLRQGAQSLPGFNV